jgi:hypothetical protein
MMMADDHAGNTRLMIHTTLIPMFAGFFFCRRFLHFANRLSESSETKTFGKIKKSSPQLLLRAHGLILH